MPENLKGLYRKIWDEGEKAGLSLAQRHYAVGWIFFDLFERADHDEVRTGSSIAAVELDRLASEIPDGKIARSMSEAQEEFGEAAARFMEDEIQLRIDAAIDESVVTEVKAISSDIKAQTGGVKTFLLNISSGVISGFVFAVMLMLLAAIWEHDPSPIHLEKSLLQLRTSPPAPNGADATRLPVAPPPSSATQASPGGKSP